MKEAELRKHTTCNLCGEKIGKSGLPFFWRVNIERFGVDVRAAQRQDGLAAFLGSSMLANVMGPGEDMAKPVMDPITITVCEFCAMQDRSSLLMMAEAGRVKCSQPE